VTEVQVDACSWSPYTGDSAQVLAKRKELQAAKMKQGEVIFYRFGDVSGIFQFYPARDGWNVQVDRCDDGVTGLGQNYIWDRYPGEVDPEVPAHTLSVGLTGTPTGVGACVKCGRPAAQTGPTGLGGCCGQTSMEPTENGHHPYCEWEWGTCTCDQFLWDPSTARDDPGCVYQEPNYGSDQIHLLKGVGPLGPANAQDLRDTARAQAGLGRGLYHEGLGQPAATTNSDGTVTIGDVTYMPPHEVGPTAPNWGFPPTTIMTPGTSTTSGTEITLPSANQSPPGSTAVAPGSPGTWVGPVAPATPTPTNTGLLIAGLAVIGLGLGGIAYLAHARTVTGS
jgi:hypothetical protein